MEQYPENYTKQLQRLLALVSDSKKHYQHAAENIKSPEFKDLLKQYGAERESIIAELKQKIASMGGNPDEDEHGFLSILHRGWLEMKAKAAGKGDQELLEACRNTDQALLDGYDDVLQGTLLEHSDLKTFVSGQRLAINESFWELDRHYFNLFNTNNSI